MVLLSIICLWPGHQRYNPLSHAVFWPEHPAVFEICQFVGVTHTSPTTHYRFQNKRRERVGNARLHKYRRMDRTQGSENYQLDRRLWLGIIDQARSGYQELL